MKAVEERFPVQGTGFDNLVILIVVPILGGREGETTSDRPLFN